GARIDGLLEQVQALSAGAVWAGEELVLPGAASQRPQLLDVVRQAGAEILALTAEEGRLDAFYRELVAQGRT
ncbi:MAG: hypothetical protein ABI880_13885, partial [Acidobacteriota bacterium]